MTIEIPRIALVGYGRWGRNHARVLHELSALAMICDSSPERLAQARQDYPGIPAVASLEQVAAAGLSGAVVATPAALHAEHGRLLLAAGLHLLVEKPLAMKLAEAEELVRQAGEGGRVLQVGHILEYHPARRVIEELVSGGRLGRLRLVRLVRTSPGTIRSSEDVVLSFAPHDISFALALAGRLPEAVAASGFDLLDRDLADAAQITLRFGEPAPFSVQIFVSWMEPAKEHRALIVGSGGMVEWNDTPGKKGLTFYESALSDGPAGPRLALGEPSQLEVPPGEPLRLELTDFLRAIGEGSRPRSDGEAALAVGRVLEACRRSLAERREVALPRAAGSSVIHPTAEIGPGAQIGADCRIWHHCHVMAGCQIEDDVVLGQNCFVAAGTRIGRGCRIQNNVSVYEGVMLAEEVFVGPSAVFTNVRFPRAFVSRKREYEKTVVQRGATIGANSTIVCGVVIGAYSFVAAGAVVTRNVPPHALVEGVPAVHSGWMCRCGERLRFGQAESATCHRCARSFRRNGQGIEPAGGGLADG